ncbi:hypothetical protein GB937_001251 [Aspergillus fischeri]|nr:hypothetical protein GB937_001251 [Aspergillus fischeri]
MSFYPPGWDYERVMNCRDRAIELLRFRWVKDPSWEGASLVEVSRHPLLRDVTGSSTGLTAPVHGDSCGSGGGPQLTTCFFSASEDRKKILYVVAVSRSRTIHVPSSPLTKKMKMSLVKISKNTLMLSLRAF